MGNAEIETFHLSVSSVENRPVGFLEPRNPLRHIHPTRVFAAGQAERLITLFWKYLEPIRRQPRPPPLRILAMAIMPLGDPLLCNLRQLHLQCIEMGNRRRARRHVAFCLFSEFKKVVVVAPILHLFRPGVRPLANGK